ncbi:TPA: DUF5376 family protein [Pasteurella multocida]|nr:DUF5376 family protein [Pasteurella multocida]
MNSFNRLIPICDSCSNYPIGSYVATYIRLFGKNEFEEKGIYDDIVNISIENEFVGFDGIDAFIEGDKVRIGFYLYGKGDEPEDYDPEESEFEIIDRKELIYILKRWKVFIHKPIIDPHYQEIIDTKEAYL